MPQDEKFSNSNFDEVFGPIESVHRIDRGCFGHFIVPLILLGLCLFGYAAYLGSGDWVTLPVCVLPFLVLFLGVLWHQFATRTDELRFYKNGFTYRAGRKMHTCLWNEIETCTRRELAANEIGRSEEDLRPLRSIKKKNGEVIAFESEVDGTTEILRRFETH